MIYFTNILLLQIYFFFGMVFVSKRFFLPNKLVKIVTSSQLAC